MSRRHAPAIDLTDADPALVARFWAKVDRGGPDDCWPWLAHRKPSGYGQFTLRKGVFMTASRVALALTQPIPDGHCACHVCDNPPCCNPRHLFAGDQRANILDSVAKGRARRARGEFTPAHKLTWESVRLIRAEPYKHGLHAQLAREYGVAGNTILSIRRGNTWREDAA